MHQQHALAVELDDRAVAKQPAAGVAAEAVAQHEVAVAVHHEARHTGGGEVAQCRDDLALRRVGVVVADPDFEQVAQDVERARDARLAAAETRGIAS